MPLVNVYWISEPISTLQWTGEVTNWCIMVDMAGSNTKGTRNKKPNTQMIARAPRKREA